MRKASLILTSLALSFLVGCGDKQAPTTTPPGGGLGGDGSGISPITPITPSTAPTDFNPPGDDFEPDGTPTDGEPTDGEPTDGEPSAEPSVEPSTEPSAEPTAEPTEAPPVIVAPTSVTSASIGLSGFTLNWVGPENASVYRVYLDGVLKADNVNGKAHIFTSLTQGTKYSVEITAVTAKGEESAKSEALEVTTTSIPLPTDVAQSELVHNGAKLTWTAASGATGYNVFLNGTKVGDNVTGTTYTLTGLTQKTAYKAQVSTITSAGESLKTEELSFTTPAMPDPYGNEKLGYLQMPAMESADGLDVKNGHAYVGHYVAGGLFSTHKRFVRDLNVTSGVVGNVQISTQGTSKVAGVAVNGSEIWASLSQPDSDSYLLYRYNALGTLIKSYKFNISGIVTKDVAIAPNGIVYMAVGLSNASIIRFDPVAYGNNPGDAAHTDLAFGGTPLVDPAGLGTDGEGNVYTFDVKTSKIVKFKSDGSRLLEFGPKGVNNAGETFTAVSDVAVDPRNGDIYVSANAAATIKIFRFDSSGNFLRSFKDADLIDPRKLTVDSEGKVYAVDATKKGVVVFTPGIKP